MNSFHLEVAPPSPCPSPIQNQPQLGANFPFVNGLEESHLETIHLQTSNYLYRSPTPRKVFPQSQSGAKGRSPRLDPQTTVDGLNAGLTSEIASEVDGIALEKNLKLSVF